MSDQDKIRNTVISNLRACLISAQGGIQATRLNNDYKQLVGEGIPFKKLGFNSLEVFLESLPDICIRRKNGECFVEAQASENSEHISKLVERQKKSNSKKHISRKSHAPVRRPNHLRQPPRFNPQPVKCFPRQKSLLSQFKTLPPQRPANQMNFMAQPPYNSNQRYQHLGVPNFYPHTPIIHSQSMNYSQPNSMNPHQKIFSIPQKNPPMQNVSKPSHSSPKSQPQNSSNSQNSGIGTNIAPTEKVSPIQSQMSKQSLPSDMKPQQTSQSHNSSPPTGVVKSHEKKKISSDGKKPMENKKLSNNSTFTKNQSKSKKSGETKVSKFSNFFSLVDDKVPTDFLPTSYVNKLVEYAHENNWPKPEFYILNRKSKDNKNKVICRTSIISQSIAEHYVGECFEYSTYPEEFTERHDAMEAVAAKAYNSLIMKNAIKLPMATDNNLIIERIAQLVSGKNQGIWAFQINSDYANLYNEMLPPNLIDILMESKLDVTKLSDTQYIVHGRSNSIAPTQLQEPQVIPPLILPDSDIWDVYVTRVCFFNQIVVRLIGDEYSAEFEKLGVEMDQYYNDTTLYTNAEVLEVGRYYIYIEKEACLRVLVTEMVNDQPRVMFIDIGDTEIVTTDSLHIIHPNFLCLPGQAIQTYMSGLEHYEFSTLKDDIYDKIIGKSFIGQVTSRDPLCLILNDTSDLEDINVNDLIKKYLFTEFLVPTLKEVGEILEVVVVHISKMGDVYVQIPSSTLKCLEEKLEQIDGGDYEVIDVIKTEQLTLMATYFIRGERTQRVKLTGVVSLEEVEVNFIDTGLIDQVKIEQLFCIDELNDLMANIPGQALRVSLHEVRPEALTNEKIALLHDLLPNYSTALAKVISLGDVPVLELYRRTSSNALISVTHSIALGDHLKAIEKSPNVSLENLSLNADRDVVHLEEEKFGLKKPIIPKLGKKYFDIFVLECAHPTNFMIQPVSYIQDLNVLMVKMRQFYNVQRVPIGRLNRGDLCAVHYSDGFWYRAYITQLCDSENVSVRFCDHGNMDVVAMSTIQPLEEHFKQLPFVGINAKLHGISPKYKDWNLDDIIRARQLLNYKKFVSVIRGVSTEPNSTFSTLSLEIIDTSSDIDVDVAHLMVIEGRACYS